jgi:uncharacterized protein YcaQ
VSRLELSRDEARGVMLSAQELFDRPAAMEAGEEDVMAMIDHLGVVQIDTINVVERTQYLVLWSRLGPYESGLLDRLLHPRRLTFEYWSHAASIVPMCDYAYYRPGMLRYAEHMWQGNQEWLSLNPEAVQGTLETVLRKGPMASADFERDPSARRTGPWDWYGPKESRRALEVLWTTGHLMVHSRRAGQKVYDVRERILAEAFGETMPADHELPDDMERLRYFVRRTVRALGIVTPSWIWDYFRLAPPRAGGTNKRRVATGLLEDLVASGDLVPAVVNGLKEPAYLDTNQLLNLDRQRHGETPSRTTLLSPFDSLIWDRARARDLFDYEVCFEAYVPPPKRRYGYYCLAILHRGSLVGRVDPKMDRQRRCLIVRAMYLEPGVQVSDDLVGGIVAALRELGSFLGAEQIIVDRCEPEKLTGLLQADLA